MFIDTHCHLTFSAYEGDRAMVIGNAKKAGVKLFINPGVELASSKLSVALAKKNPGVVFSALGFHPYEAQKTQDVSALAALLQTDGSETKTIVAIGECGLDYHQYKNEDAQGKKQKQRILFEEHLRLAASHHLPVIMHCRDAYEDFFSVLDSMPATPRGVIHCFSGGLQELRMAQERSLFVGIDGNVTYSKQLAHIVPQIPLASLLLETDAPYLTPVPHRGERNEPKYIPLVAQAIAALQGKTVSEVEEATTANARSLFAL
jgi:TatD DNase family protein